MIAVVLAPINPQHAVVLVVVVIDRNKRSGGRGDRHYRSPMGCRAYGMPLKIDILESTILLVKTVPQVVLATETQVSKSI